MIAMTSALSWQNSITLCPPSFCTPRPNLPVTSGVWMVWDWMFRCWMVCLGNKQRSFCRFWECIQVLHFALFCWLRWPLYFFYGFLPTVVDITVIWVKFTASSKKPASHIYDILKRNVLCSNVENLLYLELLICAISNRSLVFFLKF